MHRLRRPTALGHGWQVEREVEVGGDRSRGWIDVLAFHEGTRKVLVIEVKTEIHDVGAVERTMNWYQREAPAAARRFGWRADRVAAALLILHAAVNDDRFVSLSRLLASGFPGRAAALRDVTRGADGGAAARFVALVDPRFRGTNWLRATRVEGRRTAAPFVDYIDAVRRLETRSRSAA
jgi:hypothetical protein